MAAYLAEAADSPGTVQTGLSGVGLALAQWELVSAGNGHLYLTPAGAGFCTTTPVPTRAAEG